MSHNSAHTCTTTSISIALLLLSLLLTPDIILLWHVQMCVVKEACVTIVIHFYNLTQSLQSLQLMRQFHFNMGTWLNHYNQVNQEFEFSYFVLCWKALIVWNVLLCTSYLPISPVFSVFSRCISQFQLSGCQHLLLVFHLWTCFWSFPAGSPFIFLYFSLVFGLAPALCFSLLDYSFTSLFFSLSASVSRISVLSL